MFSPLFLLFHLWCTAATDYVVYPTTYSSSNRSLYLILSDYVRDANQFFASDNKLLFMNGDHHLKTMLHLVSLTNITLRGTNSSDIIIDAGAGIVCTNTSGFFLQSLKITHQRQVGPISSTSYSAIAINMSYFISYNVRFRGHHLGQGFSRAISIIQSEAAVINCSFYDGHSYDGGAISVLISTIIFCGDNIFSNNKASYSGGAIFSDNSSLVFNNDCAALWNNKVSVCCSVICIKNNIYVTKLKKSYNGSSKFFSNNAELTGGAISMVNNSFLQISSSIFLNNSAGHYGGAIDVTKSTAFLFGDIKIAGNKATNGGALSSVFSTIIVGLSKTLPHTCAQFGSETYVAAHNVLENKMNIVFQNNTAGSHGGGWSSYWSNITITGTVNFTSNQAYRGGGLASHNSVVDFKSPLTLMFYSNTAKEGGAIFYEVPNVDPLKATETNCFFMVTIDNPSFSQINIDFLDSHAEEGIDIFGKNLDTCKVYINNTKSSILGYQFFDMASSHNYTSTCLSISSFPCRLCVCENGIYNCSIESKELIIPPGKTFNISVIGVGPFNKPVFSIAVHHIESTVNIDLLRKHYNSDVYKSSCFDIGFVFFTTSIKTFEFNIFPYKGKVKLSIGIVVGKCPPGFELITNNCTCEKNLSRIFKYSKDCDIDTGLIKRPKHYWLKPLRNNSTYTGYVFSKNCPEIFCKEDIDSDPTWLNFSNLSSADVDQQCNANRTGILCGTCKQGFSLTLGNLNCALCENRYISLLLFFMAAGIIVVAVSLLLHMNISTGTLNGLILYANLVNISKDQFFPPQKVKVTLLTVFISWMNLDFGIPVCFYHGLDAYSYAWLQFAFPFYLWILTILIIICSKYATFVGKLLGSNPVAMLATIILLSYTKLLQVCIGILSSETVLYSNGTSIRLWKLDPTVEFFKGDHIVIAVFSLFILTFFLAPYTFLLLFGYHLQACSGRRGFRWFNKFKPLLDAYYAPFTCKTRYWPGLLLLLRVSILISHILDKNNATLIIESLLLSAILSIPSIGRPIYEKRYVNILETSFILNIIILASGTYCIIKGNGNQLVLSFLSTGLVLTEFVGIIFFHIWCRMANPTLHQKLIIISSKIHWHAITKKNKAENIELEKQASPSTTTVDIREPLLES